MQYTQPTDVVDQTFASAGSPAGGTATSPGWSTSTSPDTATEGNLFFLNDDYFELVINQNGDFVVHPFQQPTNQFVITSLTTWPAT